MIKDIYMFHKIMYVNSPIPDFSSKMDIGSLQKLCCAENMTSEKFGWLKIFLPCRIGYFTSTA